jgi:hypothetical protein
VGTFDISINVAAGTTPVAGSAPIECRNGNTLTLVVTFDKAMTSGSASIGAGTAIVGTPTFSGSTMTLPLTGVTNAQALQVNLTNLQSSDGGVLANAVVTLRELIGDTTGDGQVGGADMLQTQSRLGKTVDNTNFRSDVTCDGQIGGADMLLIQSKNPSSVP